MAWFRWLFLFTTLSLTPMDRLWARDTASVALLPSERNTIAVFEKVAASVVNVSNVRYQRHLFSYDVSEIPAGSGSGFVWDRQGHIVTNFHVIRGANKLVVSFKDGSRANAQIVGVEPRKDVAVLKVEQAAAKLPPSLQRARSATVQVGQKAIAIGSPFGLDQTMTAGIVSALDRAIPGVGGVTIRGMIQTDASINPGNSGGPLLDSAGRLIGMNTVIYSPSGSSAGIGFAVPSDTISRVVSQLIRHGRVIQPGIGVMLFSDSVRQRLGIEGVLINEVQPGSPAARAGLRGTKRNYSGDIILGDIIVGINGKPVRNYDDMYNILERLTVGDVVSVKFRRGPTERTQKIKLIEVNAPD